MSEKFISATELLKMDKLRQGAVSVPVKDREEGIELGFSLSPLLQRVGWACLIDGEGGLRLRVASGHPCYGELRKYGKDATDKVVKPSDLKWPFPRNVTPLAIVAPSHGEVKCAFHEYMVSEESSPFQEVLKGSEVRVNGDKGAILLSNMDIDPTAILCFLMTVKNFIVHLRAPVFDELVSEGFSRDEAGFACLAVSNTFGAAGSWAISPNYYTLGGATSLTNWKNKKLIPQCEGTFAQGWDYNRPTVHDVFKGEGADKLESLVSALGPMYQAHPSSELLPKLRQFFDTHRGE